MFESPWLLNLFKLFNQFFIMKNYQNIKKTEWKGFVGKRMIKWVSLHCLLFLKLKIFWYPITDHRMQKYSNS